MNLILNDFEELISNNEFDLILTSPYKKNNLIVISDFKQKSIRYHIYNYIYDPIEPEVQHLHTVTRGESIYSPLKNKVKVELILPGENPNEIVILDNIANIWKGSISKNRIDIKKRIGKIHLDTSEYNINFFDLYYPKDIVVYFTKKTKDFACIVVKEENSFYLLLNKLLFSKIEEENFIIEFEDSKALWNSSSENLDLCSFNLNSGLSVITFPKNKLNKEVPISIKNLKSIKEIPFEICRIDENIYALTKTHLIIFPNFKKYKRKTELEIPFIPNTAWFEPTYRKGKIFHHKMGIFDFILSPTLSKINIKQLNKQKKISLKEANNFKNKYIGSRHLGIIYNNSTYIIWTKQKHYDFLGEQTLSLKIIKTKIPDALESLKKLKNLNLINTDLLNSQAEAALPKSWLKTHNKTVRYYSKNEDIYILNHIYNDMGYVDLAKELKRTPISIYTHLNNIFGTPSCEDHSKYNSNCQLCSIARKEWLKQCLDIIKQRKYSKIVIDHSPGIKFDYDKWVINIKKRRIEKKTSFFKKLITEEIYYEIIDFMAESDLLKGRTLNSIFEQCLQVFIDDYLRKSIDSETNVSNKLLELYFSIEKNMSVLKYIIKEYRNRKNKNYRPLGNLNFYFKEILNSYKIYPENIVELIKKPLLVLYKKFFQYKPKEGYLPAILYIFFKNFNKPMTQSELSNTFSITEVTLRVRLKEIEDFMNNQAFLNDLKILKELIRKAKMNIELIKEEREKINDLNKIFKKKMIEKNYLAISKELRDLNIKYPQKILKDFRILEELSNVYDEKIIVNLIDFIIEYQYRNQKIYQNLTKYLGSDNPKVRNNIIKLIKYMNPKFKNLDLFKILGSFNKRNVTPIIGFINDYHQNSKITISIKNFLKKNLEILPIN